MSLNVVECPVKKRALSMHDARAKSIAITLTIVSIVSFGLPAETQAATAADKFVRTSNNYMKAGITLPSSDYAKLAAYDVLVLPAEAQIFNPDFFPAVRRLNPCLLYTSPSPRDRQKSRMPSSAWQ